VPEKECKKGQEKLGTIKVEGSSSKFSLLFEPESAEKYPADRFAWYQLMYREYEKSNGNLLEIDIFSSGYESYQSGRKPFTAETADWILDAKLGSAVYQKSYSKAIPTSQLNKIDDAPTWSTNFGYWGDGNKDLYRSSLKDAEQKFTGKAVMHFLDLLVYYDPKYVYNDHGVMAEYDIVHQVLFRVEWEIEQNKSKEQKEGSGDGLLVWEDLDYKKFTSGQLKQVIDSWNKVALGLSYSAMNVPLLLKNPTAFTKPK
jgi:hypothetical protein